MKEKIDTNDKDQDTVIDETTTTTTTSPPKRVEVSNDPRAIAESIVGSIAWLDHEEGYCECPGKQFHTSHDGEKDCKIYLASVPTFHCFHSSCESAVRAANTKLRQAFASGELGEKRKLTAEDREKIKERQRKESLRRRAANAKGQILRDNKWTYDQISKDSPTQLADNISGHWKMLLGCYQPGDVVWIGDTRDSGKVEHQDHFKTIDQWQIIPTPSGQYTCPAVFKTGSYARTNANVVVRRFLVVESDTLGRDEVGAIFKWMRDVMGLDLRAVVDTAGKSLHAWFKYPPDLIVDELKLALPELGCDPKLFTASQPVRLPGALRDGKYQKLVYLAKEVR